MAERKNSVSSSPLFLPVVSIPTNGPVPTTVTELLVTGLGVDEARASNPPATARWLVGVCSQPAVMLAIG